MPGRLGMLAKARPVAKPAAFGKLRAFVSFSVVAGVALSACSEDEGARRDPPEGGARAELRFSFRDGSERTITLPSQLEAAQPRPVAVKDPNHGEERLYRALPFARVLSAGFRAKSARLERANFAIHASDGYRKPISGRALVSDDAYLALSEAGRVGFEELGLVSGVDPGPLYLVWTGTAAASRPWVWSVSRIEWLEVNADERKTALPESASPRARAGRERFLKQCFGCHAINRQGGRVGPELNVPKNITEYRSETYLRSFIRNPESYRYGSSMPAQNYLSDRELDEILAYLEAMKSRKLP
jgi:mono/diheme cytochrome c family protein